MEFISDAEMRKLEAPDFISDADIQNTTDAPEFIPDPSYIGEIGTGVLQGVQNAGASFAKLGAGTAAFLTDDRKSLPQVNERIDKFFGVDKHQELQTIPGKVTQTVANIIPYMINKPAAIAGVGTMYNDLVDDLVSKGIPLSRAREIALKENAAMLVTAAVVGVPGAKLLSKVIKPTTDIAKRGIQAVAGGTGFELGTEAQVAVHNKELADRADLQRHLTTDERIVSALSGGILGGAHKPLPEKQVNVKPKDENPFGLAPEFKAVEGGMSKGEFDLLSNARKLIEDKAERINQDISRLEQVVGKTGEVTPDIIESFRVLEEAMNRAIEDLVEHDKVMSGDVTADINANKALQVDIRKQEIIAALKAKRPQVENTFIPQEPVNDAIQKTPPIEVALTKIEEARKESKEQVADRILETSDKLDALVENERLSGQDHSALREALQQEIKAYEAIQRGETPDLSWFGGEPAKPTFKSRIMPTADEVMYAVKEAKTVREVFDIIKKEDLGTRGQRQLLSLLERNEHVLNANFRIGLARIRGDKSSRGLYNTSTHTFELHNGGNIKTILHEAVHAATVAMLDQGTAKSAKAMIDLYEKYKAFDDGSYGFTNVKEFVSEAFTNSRFQKLLQSIPSGEVTPTGRILKMWDKFKEIIKSGLKATDEVRTALDDVLDVGSQMMEVSAKKPEAFFQKLSNKKPAFVMDVAEQPYVSTGDLVKFAKRKMFGINTLEGLYRDNPRVQNAFKEIRASIETADKIQNSLWHNTADVLRQGKVGFMDTLGKVRDKSSAIAAVMTTPNADMALIHDLFKRGFQEGLEYSENLRKNGESLTPEQTKVYNTLSKLFSRMYEETVKVQEGLGKKHVLPYREGWYPAKRLGEFSVEISFRGNNVHIESFKTRIAAENFRKKITDGANLKHLEVSDVLTKEDVSGRQPNAEMAEIIGDYLAQKYPTAGEALQKTIDNLVHTMQTRGGKLGYHHQHRTNVPGYRGSELFLNREKLGSSFKEGIQGEVNNFGMNLRTLMIKHNIEPRLSDQNFRITDPDGYNAVKQMYETTLGRNEDFLGTKLGGERVSHAMDKVVSQVMIKALGREFEGKKGSAYNQAMNVAMRAFYATKMMAKPIFILSQILTTPMIIPELARKNHGARAFYSFGKAMTKLMTGDKELWNHLKEMSQEYNITESQFLESMNLDKHSGRESKVEKFGNAVEDYVMFGKVGKGADSMSRLFSYAASFTHYTDLGFTKPEAARLARLATDKAMNTYDSASSAPMFENLGIIGQGMKPLTSFGLNQLGNFFSYVKAAKKGDVAPIMAYGLIATAMGGVLSLPFIQEYERLRKVLEMHFDVSMPSILEIFSGDESFLDRLNITSQDAKDVAMFGLPALSGIDLTSSMRSNETLIAIAAAVALGQEDAKKLFPIIGATIDTVKALPAAGAAVMGRNSVAEGRTAIDSLITGPIGYGAKEALGLNTTKVFGQNTGMINAGKKGDADIQRTGTDIAAGFLGGRSIEQRRTDMMTHELTAKEKIRQQKVANNINMLVETGDKKYITKLIDLGVTGDQIESGIESGIYNKNVGQYIRFFMNASGAVDERKAGLISNFGIKR